MRKPETQRVELVPGGDLESLPHGARAEHLAGDERLPFEHSSRLRLEPLGPGGKLRGFSQRSREAVRFRASAPGAYRVHLPPIEGFAPVEPFELVLHLARPAARRVDLERVE
jgi:hypothetical protein